MKRKNIISTLACSIAALAFTACADVWEEHYQPNPELNATETLWDLIEDDPELSEFKAYLKATGYDTLLRKNRFYTVWAPVNGAEYFKNHSAEDKQMVSEYRKELVENHIADYSHVAGGKLAEDNLVKMLNGKYISFENASGNCTFKGVKLSPESNKTAKNGILHKIEGYADFTANIWEQLAKEESLDSLYSFLFKDYKREPNWGASVQGPMVDGQIVYLDTAWTVTCPWFNSLGQLNREDSSYTMFALTNNAWNEMYETAKTYFTYSAGYKDGDSLQDALVKELMCRNLVFSDKVNKKYENGNSQIPYDTLVSNYNLAFTYEPLVFAGEEVKALYNGARTLALSNGTLNIVDQVNYDPLKCWHDTIRSEAENLLGGISDELDEYKNCEKVFKWIDKDSVKLYNSVSGGALAVFDGKTENPSLRVKINNVLSACYRVKLVVLPPQIINSYDTLYIKPNKFTATLTCGNAEVANASQDIVLGRKDSCVTYQGTVYSDPTRIDTIELVPLDENMKPTGVDYVEIPVCEYNVESKLNGTLQTKLNIVSTLTGNELKRKPNYIKKKEAYISANREYVAAYQDWLVASQDTVYTQEEIDELLLVVEKKREDMEEAKLEVDEMDSEAMKYFDNALRIDQIILEPVNPNKE